MKKSVLVITTFIFLIGVSLAFVSVDAPKYKNLKILKKDITKEELDSVMHFFSMSLGEKCGFCHVRNEAEKTMDFASDANPHKDVARYMMRMTAKINKKYFTDKEKKTQERIQAVTCYSCHHGSGSPAVKPPQVRRDSVASRQGNTTNLPGDSARRFPADSAKSQH